MPAQTREELMAIPQDLPWQSQMSQSYRKNEQIAMVLDGVDAVDPEMYKRFDMRVSPYMAQLMDPADPACPIRRQYLISNREVAGASEFADSLGEEEDTIGGTSIVHRYPRRVLFLVYNVCGSYCRYCTRARMVSDPTQNVTKDVVEQGLDYIAANTSINDVLLSGGDPLLLADKRLDYILGEIRRRAPHVRFLRIGSRLPVQMPSRITEELCNVLERHGVNLLNVHVNHPKEVTPYFQGRMRRLAKTGIMLGNQSVLLKGVNDDPFILTELNMRLLECQVKPYYVYTSDPVEGNSQWYVSYKRTLEIIECMRGWNSGPSMPTFVLDGVSGLGKLPIQPEYVTMNAEGHVLCRNYEGKHARAAHLE